MASSSNPGSAGGDSPTRPAGGPDDIARFRPLRVHARGGLGEVLVAEDGELRRQVALKRIRADRTAGPQDEARFVLEAEVTGQLEHPGVVPVYGLGRQADGKPYYAMRLIGGESMADAIRALHAEGKTGKSADGQGADAPRSPIPTALSLRQLLARFVSVCNTIAFAHSRGVIHRDIKPGNIMLGRYGETLVVDWGLAKLMSAGGDGNVGGAAAGDLDAGTLVSLTALSAVPDTPAPVAPPAAPVGPDGLPALSPSAGAATQMGTALGTLGYMAPEQAAGRLDLLGPAADIYALGATLYHLLTGRSAMSGAVLEMIMKTMAGQFPRPRQVKPDVPAALEAICLKAMALEAADRYPDALALAQDLERWLADEPVSVWREPWGARAGRWIRRHRTLVGSAAAGLVAVSAGLAAVSVVVADRNTRLVAMTEALDQRAGALAKANQAEHDALRIAEAARDAERESARQARESAARAEAALKAEKEASARAEAALNSEHRAVEQAEAALKAEKEASARAEAALKAEKEASARAAAALKAEKDATARATAAAAEAARQRDQALEEHQRAEENLDGGKDLADRILQRLADPAFSSTPGLREVRVALLESAADYYERLTAQKPDTPRSRLAVATAFRRLGTAQRDVGKLDKAEYNLRMAGTLLDGPDDDKSLDGARRAEKAIVKTALGQTYVLLKQTDDALAAYEEALALRKKIAELRPNMLGAKLELAACESMVGGLMRGQDRRAAALEHLKAALAVRQALADAHPKGDNYHAALAAAQHAVGEVAHEVGLRDDALTAYRAALAEREKLAKSAPSAAAAERKAELAATLLGLGAALAETRDAKQREEAAGHLKRSIEIRRDLLGTQPDNAALKADLARSLDAAGRLESISGRPDPGATLLEEAVRRFEELARDKASPLRPELALARLHLCRALAIGSAADRRRSKSAGDKWDVSATRHAESAVAALAKAVEAGYDKPKVLESDRALDSLRDRDDFRKLLADLNARTAMPKGTK